MSLVATVHHSYVLWLHMSLRAGRGPLGLYYDVTGTPISFYDWTIGRVSNSRTQFLKFSAFVSWQKKSKGRVPSNHWGCIKSINMLLSDFVGDTIDGCHSFTTGALLFVISMKIPLFLYIIVPLLFILQTYIHDISHIGLDRA